MIVKSIILRNARGAMGGIVATPGINGETILRSMPKKGNQGRATSHAPAQSRARIVGRFTRIAKTVIRGSFTDYKEGLSAVNRFQQLNMDSEQGAVKADGSLDFPNLIVSEGSAGSAGLVPQNWAATVGNANSATIPFSFNTNANGANIELKVIVYSSESYEGKIVSTGIKQDSADVTVDVDVTGYQNPVLYLAWYDSDEKSISKSVYVVKA